MRKSPERMSVGEHTYVEMREGDINFGVVILPPPEVRETASRLTDQIETRAPLLFRVDRTHIPHITLFQGGFPQSSEMAIEDAVQEVIDQSSQPLEITMEDKLYLARTGNVFWNAVRTEELQKLHAALIKALRPLTEGRLMRQWVERLQNPRSDLTAERRRLVLKNGFADSGKLFLPHFTLGRLARKEDFEKLPDIQVTPSKFPLTTIVGGYLGEVGNLEKIAFPQPARIG